MIAEIGQYALILALALALVQTVLPAWGARTGDATLMSVATPVAYILFLFVGSAFAALVALYLTSDFSVVNVVDNSHSRMPTIY